MEEKRGFLKEKPTNLGKKVELLKDLGNQTSWAL
jgi:hypothetical protein